jgi:hypothetical protein
VGRLSLEDDLIGPIQWGLDSNAREALKARVLLREWFDGGRIDLERKGEELWAVYGVQPSALLKVVGNRGSGGVIRLIPTRPIDLRLSLAA